MKLEYALPIAQEIKNLLEPHCERIEIAGSIRRGAPLIGNIDIVCIAKPYECKGMFITGIAEVIEQWKFERGKLPGKHVRRIYYPKDDEMAVGIMLDISLCNAENWGYILAIRTGSSNYAHHILAKGWRKAGYYGDDGMMHRSFDKKEWPIYEEKDLFKLIGIPYAEPRQRGQVTF